MILDTGCRAWTATKSPDDCEATRPAGVTLVALTAFGQGIDGRRFEEVGFDHHLAKPVDVDALIQLIGRSQAPSGETPNL